MMLDILQQPHPYPPAPPRTARWRGRGVRPAQDQGRSPGGEEHQEVQGAMFAYLVKKHVGEMGLTPPPSGQCPRSQERPAALSSA